MRLKTDWMLFLTIVFMVCLGLVIVYSASSVVAELKFHSSSHFFIRQLGWAIISFCALMYFKKLDYRVMRTPVWAFTSLGVVLLMLVMVYFLDPKNHRWFRAFGMSLQPSEFAKPALIIFLAYFITLTQRTINDRYTLLPASMALAMLTACVVLADFGTAMVLVATAAVVFYVAGLNRKYFAVALIVGVLAGGVAIVSKDR